jgi:hypothetical protein
MHVVGKLKLTSWTVEDEFEPFRIQLRQEVKYQQATRLRFPMPVSEWNVSLDWEEYISMGHANTGLVH